MPDWSAYLIRLRQNKILISSLLAIGVVLLGSFFFFVQPTMHTRTTQDSLQQYFAHCYDLMTCFSTTDLQDDSTFSLLKNNNLSDLITAITHLSQRREKLDQHLATYYATVWQNQAGDVNGELQIIEQTLTSVLGELDATQTLFAKNQTTLQQFVDVQALDNFSQALDDIQAELDLLQKNLPFLKTIAQAPSFPVTLVFLDQHAARSGGGLVLGLGNLVFDQGQLLTSTYATTSQLASSSAISVNTPRDLAHITTTETSGMHNLTYNRSFAEASTLLAQANGSAFNFQPELTVGVNLDTLALLQQQLLGTSGQETLSAHAPYQTTIQNEQQLLTLVQQLDQRLATLPASEAPAFVYQLLGLLDAQAFQFYTDTDSFAHQIAELGLDADSSNIFCPSGFGSQTCFLDTFVQNDNYLAANLDLEQKINHLIELTLNQTYQQRQMTFTNHSVTQKAVDYLTFQLPVGSELVDFQVDHQDATLDEHDGYLLTLAPGQSATLTLTYTIERTIASSDFTYSFYNQHQNGLPDQQLQVVVRHQLPYAPKIIAPSAVSNQNTITFNRVGDRSFFGAVVF